MTSPNVQGIRTWVREELTRMMGEFLFDEDDFDLHEGLADLGFDSLSRADLLGKVNSRFCTEIPLDVMLGCHSLADLGEHLIGRYGDRLGQSGRHSGE